MANPISRFRQRIFRHRPDDSLPATVTHQRIYILPSGRGFAFLLALLLMLISAINYSLSLGYALCFLLCGLHAATLLKTYRNLAGLRIDAIGGSKVFADDTLSYSISLSSADGKARHGIELRDKEGNHTSTEIPTGSAASVARIELSPEKRGPHKLGRITLTSDWPLGLWRTWSYFHAPTESLVYPARERNPPPLPANDHDGNGEQINLARQGEFAGLRAYQNGDSPAHVAWKQAARGQGLLVRLFDEPDGLKETHLALAATGISGLESQLSRLAAWVMHCESSQQDYALALGSTLLDYNHGPEQQRQALEALAWYGIAREGYP